MDFGVKTKLKLQERKNHANVKSLNGNDSQLFNIDVEIIKIVTLQLQLFVEHVPGNNISVGKLPFLHTNNDSHLSHAI